MWWVVVLWVAVLVEGWDPSRVRTPPVPFRLLPLQWGAVGPQGWIRDWATFGRNGAVSPVHGWFAGGNGKNGRANGWKDGQPDWAMDEQSAYWIDGMTRLGLVLDDSELKARSAEDILSVVRNYYFGEPKGGGPEGWPRSVYSRAMLAYFDAVGDTGVLSTFARAWSNYTMDPTWDARSMTQAEAMLEGFAFGGVPAIQVSALKGLQSHWSKFKEAWVYPRCSLENISKHAACLEDEHGVTWNELAKLWAIASVWNEDNEYLAASINAYAQVDQRDMLPYGVNSAQEALSGIGPNASTELCDVSDFQHSNTWLLRVAGRSCYGDRLEKAFHNAAPGALNRNYTQHVYYQSPNLRVIPNSTFREPGDRWRLHVFHNPPCCTGNQARLLPNYIHHMWMATPDHGLAATMYGPNHVTTKVGPSLTDIMIHTNTTYPFTQDVHIYLHPSSPVDFPLHLRHPSWCSRPSIRINGKEYPLPATVNGFYIIRRTWKAGDAVYINLPMVPVVTKDVTVNNGGTWTDNYNAGNRNNYVVGGLPYATVTLGPLLFALALEGGEQWQYALDLDEPLIVEQDPMPSIWDWPRDPPLRIIARGRRISWPDVWFLPRHPVSASTPLENVTLVPYGCSKVFKVSMFPYLAK